MDVMIGVDPHRRSRTAMMLDRGLTVPSARAPTPTETGS